MKILCISDFIDPLVYSPNIKNRFSDIDLILCAGDLPLDYLDFIISSLNKPLLFVFGNHHINRQTDPDDMLKNDWSTNHIGSKIKIEEDLIIAGLGGCMRYNRGQNQYSEFQMLMEIFKLIPSLIINKIFRKRYLDILLTHAPPKGIHDKEDKCHRGFKVFLWFMEKFKPKFLIHGHIHLYDLSDKRITKWKNTTIINAYSHYVLIINKAEIDG